MSGLFGKAALAASTYTMVAQNTTGATITANIRVVNRDVVNSTAIRLAVCPSSWVSGAPANADYIEAVDLPLLAGQILEDFGVAIGNGEQVVAYANSASVTVRVMGF